MNWNNDKLNAIQQMEYELIVNPSGISPLFTNLIHSTSEWIDKDFKYKEIHISPFKAELDKTVDLIAYYIECGNTTEVSISLVGKDRKTITPMFTDTHHRILWAARKQRLINKLKNK